VDPAVRLLANIERRTVLRGSTMPTYDFRCGGCRKRFTLTMSISQRDRKRVKCPKCGSTKAEAIFSSFFAKTSKKS